MSYSNSGTIVQFISGIRDGGAESLVRDYAIMLNQRDIPIVIVTIEPPKLSSGNYHLLKEAGIKIVSVYSRFPLTRVSVINKLWNRLFYNKYVQFRLKRLFKELQPKCIHTHLEIIHHLKPLSKFLHNVKLLYTCHSEPNRYFNNSDRKRELEAAKYLIKHNNFQCIALHSKMQAELNQILGVDHTVVIKNGVDFSRYYDVQLDVAQKREQEGIPTDAFVVGHIGRFVTTKNHAYLLDVFKRTLAKNDKSHLLLIGDGPLKETIQQQIRDCNLEKHVTILSHRSDIPSLLKCMDVFVMPSIFEGLPVTLVEAQIVGLRCVVSDRITNECFLSDRVVPLNIDIDAEVWAQTIVDTSIKGECSGDISAFNMQNIISELEKMYYN